MRSIFAIQKCESSAVFLRHFFGCGPNSGVLKNDIFGRLSFLFFLLNFGGLSLLSQNPADIDPNYGYFRTQPLEGISLSSLNPDNVTVAIATDPQDFIYTLSFGSGVDKRKVDGTIDKTDFISPAQLESPLDMAIDEEGFIYIADYSDDDADFNKHGKIRVFDAEGRPDRVIYTGFYRPMGLHVNSESIYIAEYYDGQQGPEQGSQYSRVSIYSKETSSRILKNEDDVEVPYRIAVNSEGIVYVSQAGDDDPAVLIFDEDLHYDRKLSNILSPGSLVVDKYDYLHVIEYGGRISFGQLLDFSNIDLNGAINFTHQIYHGIDDNAFGVKVFNSNNSLIDFFKEEINFPIDITFNGCDKFYVLNSNVIPLIHFDNFLGHEFVPSELRIGLEIYNRTPTYDSVQGPIITCPGDIEATAEPGDNFAEVEFDDAVATDNCSATVEQTFGDPSGSEFLVGTHRIEFTATDSFGNASTCEFQIIVLPSEEENLTPPVFSGCEDLQNLNPYSADAGKCGAIVNFAVPTASDEEGLVTVNLISSLGPGDQFPIGATTVTYEAKNTAGTSTCSFTVMVKDDEAPAFIDCPENITAGFEITQGFEVEDYSTFFPAIDNCAASLSYSQSPPPGTIISSGGDHVVKLTATDPAGNGFTCEFLLRLTEINTLSLNCNREIRVPANDQCQFILPDLSEEYTYFPEEAQITQSIASGQLLTEDTEVIITATYGGRTENCNIKVKLVDYSWPELICPTIQNVTVTSSEGFILPNYIDQIEANDNCEIVKIVQEPAPGTLVTEDVVVKITA